MANEAYVAEKVAEAAKSPKAILLGAIGAMSSTPTNSANVAEKELRLSKEEIQEVRWIALLKKGKTDLEFLKGLLEIIKKQKEEKMTTDKMTKVLEIVKDFSPEEKRELTRILSPIPEQKLTHQEWVRSLLDEIKHEYQIKAETGKIWELPDGTTWKVHEVKLGGRWFEMFCGISLGKCYQCDEKSLHIARVYMSTTYTNRRAEKKYLRVEEYEREVVCLSCGARFKGENLWMGD